MPHHKSLQRNDLVERIKANLSKFDRLVVVFERSELLAWNNTQVRRSLLYDLRFSTPIRYLFINPRDVDDASLPMTCIVCVESIDRFTKRWQEKLRERVSEHDALRRSPRHAHGRMLVTSSSSEMLL